MNLTTSVLGLSLFLACDEDEEDVVRDGSAVDKTDVEVGLGISRSRSTLTGLEDDEEEEDTDDDDDDEVDVVSAD